MRQGITPHLAEPSPATLDHWRPETVAACVVVVSGVVHGAAGAQAGGSGDDGTPPTMQAPPPGLMHEYVRYEGGRSHNCTYCGNKCYWYCATCAAAGYGTMAVCGPKCKGNCCRQQHTDGAPRHHGSWNMTQQGAAAVTRARQERASGTADDADDDEPMGPISPSARRSGPRALSGRARRLLGRALVGTGRAWNLQGACWGISGAHGLCATGTGQQGTSRDRVYTSVYWECILSIHSDSR